MRFIKKTHYNQDIQLFKHQGQLFWYGALGVALLLSPLVLSDFYLGELSLVFIYAIAGIGLMLLTGYTGLVSLGHAAFLAIGAYTHAYLLAQGWPFPVSILCATLLSSLVGAIIGIPALRMTGIYLAVATLAFAIIVEQVLSHWVSVTGGFRGMAVELSLDWFIFTGRQRHFLFSLPFYSDRLPVPGAEPAAHLDRQGDDCYSRL